MNICLIWFNLYTLIIEHCTELLVAYFVDPLCFILLKKSCLESVLNYDKYVLYYFDVVK